LAKVPGSIGEKVSKKIEFVLNKNPDLEQMRTISKIVNGEDTSDEELHFNLSSVQIAELFAPLTSVDAERSFLNAQGNVI